VKSIIFLTVFYNSCLFKSSHSDT